MESQVFLVRHPILEVYFRLKNLGNFLTREGFLEESRIQSADADKIGEWGGLSDSLCLSRESTATQIASQIGGRVVPATELTEVFDADSL